MMRANHGFSLGVNSFSIGRANKAQTKRMQAKARRLPVVSATSCARRRLIRNIYPSNASPVSASNYNYVCFDCRTAIRHPKTAKQAPKCLSCGAPCFCLGYKVEIPKHTEQKEWQAIHKESMRRLRESNDRMALSRVRRAHWLEHEIARLSAMPENRDRSRQIKKLREELASRRSAPTVSV